MFGFTLRAVVLLTALLATPTVARATEVGGSRIFGIGFEFPAPTAITAKLFLTRGNALDFGLGFGSVGVVRCRDIPRDYVCGSYGHYVSFHSDYLWQDNLVHQGILKLDWHIGAGGRIAYENAFSNGYLELIARMPLGLDFTFARPNFLEAFAELAPGILIVPGLDFVIDFVIGARLYF